jgi:hypothetical protein
MFSNLNGNQKIIMMLIIMGALFGIIGVPRIIDAVTNQKKI